MFDKLIDFLINLGQDILPFTIVNEWEKGVFLRFGRYKSTVEPGLNWKIPFFDKIWTHEVITKTVHLKPQTLTTLDDKSIVLTTIVRYHVYDVRKFLLSVMHANDVLIDTTQGIIRDIVEYTKWSELDDLTNMVTPEVKEEVEKWGIIVEAVKFPDLGEIKTFRIMTNDTREISNHLGIDGI